MSTTNAHKEMLIKLIAVPSALVCLCAVFSFSNDTYHSGKALDLAKALLAIFYTFYFGLVMSDND